MRRDEADAGAEPMAGYDGKGTERIYQSFRHTSIVIDSWTQQTLIESRSEPREPPRSEGGPSRISPSYPASSEKSKNWLGFFFFGHSR